MSRKYYSKENLRFLLYDVHKADSLFQYDAYKDHDKESCDIFLQATEDVSTEYLLPLFTPMDREQPYLENGRIKVHPKMREIMRMMGDGGWISSAASYEVGGNQLPGTFMYMSSFIMGCANYSATAFPYLSMGAAHLIESFGSDAQKKSYIPKMFSGEWQGTMALTEPGAGSSLSDLVTTAKKTPEGHYLIKGQKIFISCGDSDAVDNVIHLMLARVEGAPAGTKGISMFIVPRERLKDDGSTEWNDVTSAGVYHKMGYKGAPIAHLIMGENDDCRGWLIGEENKGLSYMFQMMNEARISVGLHATSIATASYYATLQYTRERSQGRPVSAKDPAQPPVPIIQHPDVRRMLLFQKSFIEAALSIEIQCSLYEDLRKVTSGEEQEKYHLLLELLTPIAKSWPAETSILSTSLAIQCLGGYGFTKDFPQEQYFREVRIHTIHEGATAIHGLDLLGRKVMMKGGKATMLLMQEVAQDIQKASAHASLASHAQKLTAQLQELQQITMHLIGIAQSKGPDYFLADATLYLELFGILVAGWQLLKQGIVAAEQLQQRSDDSFLNGKLTTVQYFFEYEIPKTAALLTRLKSSEFITLELNESHLD